MKINIHTVPKGATDLESERKNIDWKNASDRKWLQNHMHWAMHNARIVTITPMESN